MIRNPFSDGVTMKSPVLVQLAFVLKIATGLLKERGGVAEWLRRSISNIVGFTRVGSNPVVETTSNTPTDDSAFHPSEVGE